MTRLDIYELISERFDREEGPAGKAVYICTSPRTASFTLCRYMIAQGWGIPNEYYNPLIAHAMAARWSIHGDLRKEPKARAEFGRQLLSRRAAGGIFAAKLMAAQTRFFNQVHPVGFDARVENHFIHLYRNDFPGQIVSLITASHTNRWSFSEARTNIRVMEFGLDLDSVHRACRLVINSERFWKAVFVDEGIHPVEVSTEDLVSDPRPAIEAIAARIGRPVDRDSLEALIGHERGSAYAVDRAIKQEMMAKYSGVIEEYAQERAEAYRSPVETAAST